MDKAQRYVYSGGSQQSPAPPLSLTPRGDSAAPLREAWTVYQQQQEGAAQYPSQALYPPHSPHHQAQSVPYRHWPPFPPPQEQHRPPHVFPPHPHFDSSRSPSGYFTTPANLPGHTEVPPHFPPPNRDYQSNMDRYPRGHSDQSGSFSHTAPTTYQTSFQYNNMQADNYNVVRHRQTDPSHATPDQADKSINRSDEEVWQRKQDEQWITAFLQKRRKMTAPPQQQHPPPQPTENDPPPQHPPGNRPPPKQSVCDFREKLYTAVKMLSELSDMCQTLKNNIENESAWTDSYSRATELKSSLEDSLKTLTEPDRVEIVKRKLSLIKKKRARVRRKKAELEEEKREREARAVEKELAIDKYQLKKIQEIEEKNREHEMKLAADSVLSEVRKKQADANRMQDILKALEKLRKLRKEAASRKGMFPEKESDDVFEGHLTRLRTLIRKRMSVYGAEEKALRVMLEGEQEEERKRDHEKRQKKERDKLLQRKREIEMMLFGAELPHDHPLQPYQDYYTQAERSLPALIQIRRDWDQFLVPKDHPDGSSIPDGWVLPDPPADDVWAIALEK